MVVLAANLENTKECLFFVRGKMTKVERSKMMGNGRMVRGASDPW
jgi:hypothetical protein